MGTRKGTNYIVFDTETAPQTPSRRSGSPRPEESLVYDLGYVVVDGHTKEIIAERSFVIAETMGNGMVMQNAYYADKLPQYYEGMRNGTWKVETFANVRKQFVKDCKTFGVIDVWAYNGRFDKVALNHTLEVYSNGCAKWFLPYDTRLRDIWDYAQCITATPTYCRYVKKHNAFTANGNPMTTAETVYRYLTQEHDYVEHHTALEDSRIEAYILAKAKAKHTKKANTIGQGWRGAAKVYKAMKAA